MTKAYRRTEFREREKLAVCHTTYRICQKLGGIKFISKHIGNLRRIQSGFGRFKQLGPGFLKKGPAKEENLVPGPSDTRRNQSTQFPGSIYTVGPTDRTRMNGEG